MFGCGMWTGKHRFVEKKFRLYEGDLGLGEAIILKNKKGDFFGWMGRGRFSTNRTFDESGPSHVDLPAICGDGHEDTI